MMFKPLSTIQKLLVVTNVPHYRDDGRLYAHGPFVREMDIWADLFAELMIAAPFLHSSPRSDCLPYSRKNIFIQPQWYTGGDTLWAKLVQVIALPGLVWGLSRAMQRTEAIHVRCPGNFGLLGLILGPFFSRYLVAKYASNWQGYPGEIWSYKIQRALLRSRWWRGPVTVYGLWANQPAHVIPFFTSIMTTDQMEHACQVARGKTVHTPLRVLYVGRLTKEKNVDVLLKAIANLTAEGIPVIGKIVGVGNHHDALEVQSLQTGLQNYVTFTGGVTFDQVLEYYKEADVLVLVSEVEGWPKAIAEAMAFGLVCIGSQRGWVLEMLAEGRGIVIPPGDVLALTNSLREIARSPEMYTDISVRAAKWAEKYSLEGLREALRNLLEERWKVSILIRPQL